MGYKITSIQYEVELYFWRRRGGVDVKVLDNPAELNDSWVFIKRDIIQLTVPISHENLNITIKGETSSDSL